MKRSAFFAALFGAVGAAQTPVSDLYLNEKREKVGTPAWSKRKPKNNQCPVCGTMADTYKREMNCVSGYKKNSDGTLSYIPAPCGDPTSQEQRMIRCARCNAAFWQDAV